MKLSVPTLALLMATGLPLAACAQQSNAAQNYPSPSPEMRAQMQQARDNTRTAALNDLSPANRAKVQAIFDQVNNGQQTDLRAAAQQINAILSPTESAAVLGERDKMMAAMPHRDGMGPGGPRPMGSPNPNASPGAMGPGGPGMGGPGGPGMGPGGRGFGRGRNDAGRVLLGLGVTPEKMRALRMQQMQQMQGQPKPQ